MNEYKGCSIFVNHFVSKEFKSWKVIWHCGPSGLRECSNSLDVYVNISVRGERGAVSWTAWKPFPSCWCHNSIIYGICVEESKPQQEGWWLHRQHSGLNWDRGCLLHGTGINLVLLSLASSAWTPVLYLTFHSYPHTLTYHTAEMQAW